MESVRFPFDHGAPAALARRATRDAMEGWKTAYLIDDALVVCRPNPTVRQTLQSMARILTIRGTLMC